MGAGILLPLMRFSQGPEYSPHRLLRRTPISLDRYKMIIRVELKMDKFKSSTCKRSFFFDKVHLYKYTGCKV